MRGLFVTGAAGFIGRRFLGALDRSRFTRVVCLSREAREGSAGVIWARGDVAEPGSWERWLDRDTDVVHLAGGPGAGDRANTAVALSDACRRAGVAGLLHVSTIAVRYPDDPRAPYARAKREAE